MDKGIQFEVVEVTPVHGMGTIVFAKTESDEDFLIKPGLMLGSCEITDADIPRWLDENGRARTDIWAFTLKDPAEQSNFNIGDFVTLSQ